MEKPFRPCVVAVIRDAKGQVLAGERSDRPGAWQLPQGGIDPGEEPEEALMRELQEEIGSDGLCIRSRSGDWIRYNFPETVNREMLQDFQGQQQIWFLLEFLPGKGPDLSLSDGEFRDVRWMKPQELIEGIVEWKREAYRLGFAALGLLN